MRDNVDNSAVFKDFVKIAKSYGWVKEADDNDVIKDKYNVTDQTGRELIEMAHPNEVWVAEALGDGGLVENQNEQHDTLISILYKMPEGSLIGRHAKLINSLTKTANNAYLKGNISSFNSINNSIETINDNFYKKGWVGWIAQFLLAGLSIANIEIGHDKKVRSMKPGKLGKIGLIGGATAALLGIGSKLTSVQEDLTTDLGDLNASLDSIIADNDYMEQRSQAKLIKAKVVPFISRFQAGIPTDIAEAKQYLSELKKFSILFSQGSEISRLVDNISESSNWYKMGLDKASRLKEKYKDVLGSIKSLTLSTAALAKVGKEQLTGDPNLVSK